METFAPGDRVRAKAGGPDMVVEATAGATVLCVWFEDAVRRDAHLACETLTKLDASDERPDNPFETGQ